MLQFTQIIKSLTFFVIIFIAAPPSVSAQNWKLFKKNDALNCRSFATDNLHNIYILTPKNEILKYNEDGSFESRFASLKMGQIGHFDAMNPFKLLVYYPDFQSIQLLDKELNSLGSFNIRDKGVAQVGAVAMSDDGKIWVYDAGTKKILTLSHTENAQQTQGGIVPFAGAIPTQMIFRSNQLYVNVPDKGIYVFDRFGKYLKLLNIKNANYFQVFGNDLLYNQQGKMYIFNLQTLKPREMKMPEGVKGSEPLRLEKNWLFVQQGKTIVIYEETK